MGKDKLKKFAEIYKFPNVFQNLSWDKAEVYDSTGAQIHYAGKWRLKAFQNSHPLILELACGQGDYARGMGQQIPDQNFIGVDIKGNRLWSGAKRAMTEELNNVRFLRTRIQQIDQIFASEEISEIWITFPDPFLRKSRANNRLTSNRFLDVYRKILAPDGCIHLKTDSTELYEYTLEIIEENRCTILQNYSDLYASDYDNPLLDIKTKYERMHLENGKTIKYLKFLL